MKWLTIHSAKRWVFIAIFVITMGCDDFLDEAPDNRVELADLDKAAQLLTNAYSIASPGFTDWMTDDFTYTVGTTIRPLHQRLYEWEEADSNPQEQDSPEFFWYETYNAIAHANEVLQVLDELPVEEDNDAARRNAIRAEALLARAYGHFMLVNMFAREYNQSTLNNRGVPYVTTPETEFLTEYTRASVQRVYSLVEDDLLAGLELVDDTFLNGSGKYHFNRNAALAFASRYYLYKGDLERCIQYSDELLGADPRAFVRDMTGDEYQGQKSSITGYAQLYSSVEEPANLLLMRKISLVQRPDFAYGVDQNFYRSLFESSPFEATDERQNPALVKGIGTLFPLRYQSLFERRSINSNVGTPYHIGIAFRGEEVLLNRAEAKARLRRADDALADLQIFVERRYSGQNLDLTIEGIRDFFSFEDSESLDDWIFVAEYALFERRKEFLGQGIRWFDIKRFGQTVSHILPSGVSFAILDADDPRKALQIPKSAQEVGGLQPNSR